MFVSELTLAEIGRLQSEIPAFDEVLEQLRGRVALEVEIKNVPDEPGYEPSGTTLARDVVATLRRHTFVDAFVASFDAECLESVRKVDRDVTTGLLIDPAQDLDRALALTTAGQHAILLPEVAALERAGGAFIERAHELRLRICAWTVDEPAAIERIFALGADAVETNDPVVGVRVRDALTQG